MFNYIFGSLSQTSSQSITVISPNGGENWQANSSQLIKWESNDVDKVKIEYSLDNGLSWGIVAQPVDASLDEYTWIAADAKTPYVLIRISDVYNPFVYDVSDKSFALDFNEKSNLNKSAQVSSTTIKIMPLGDSITWGTNPNAANSPGYRRSLYLQLTNAGYTVDFVGSLIGGLPTDFDRDNEGHPGWEAGLPDHVSIGGSPALESYLGGYLTTSHPNIVLLQAGTNDISENEDGSNVATQVKRLLDTIYTHDNTTITFVCKIIDRADFLSKHNKTIDLDTALANRVNSLQTAQKNKVVLVDMYSALGVYWGNFGNPNFSYDSGDPTNSLLTLHPNNTGYQVMADTLFKKLQNFYQPTLVSPSDNAINQAVNLTLNWNAPPVASIVSVVYDLQIAVDLSFTNIIFEDMSVSGTSKQPTGLKYGTKYYWRVKIPGFGWSAIRNFTTIQMLVSVKVFLQGPYSSGSMSTALNTKGYLPFSQPYISAPWGYGGGEFVSPGFFTIQTTIVDWVLVQLRSSTTTVTTTKAAFLKNNGSIVDLDGTSLLKFGGISGGDYYIVIKHRNHLAVMSAIKVTLPNATVYDFTTGSDKYNGTTAGAIQFQGVWGMIAGDANGDGLVSGTDFNVFNPKFINATTGYEVSDWNMDGQVTGSDFNVFNPNFVLAKSSQVP